jgi:hypothetical protein
MTQCHASETQNKTSNMSKEKYTGTDTQRNPEDWTQDTATHYRAWLAPQGYATESKGFAVKQGAKGEEKVTVNILLHECPLESAFPGGSGWVDADGKATLNPFYAAWLKYTKDHEIAAQRRDGETEFTVNVRRDTGERGAPVRKPETVAKEIESAMERDSEGMLKAMALRLMARKGLDYETALAKVKEDWA